MDGLYYQQLGYNVAKQWLVGNANYTELNINANSRRKPKLSATPSITTKMANAAAHGTWVQRVVRIGNTATGVVVNINDATSTISLKSNGRIILSGGALKSPELLMKSDIGDPTVLTTLSAANQLGSLPSSQWINNTAVGAGLFDNPNTFIAMSAPSVQAYNYVYENPPQADQNLYLTKRAGNYAFAGGSCSFWDTVIHADGTVAGVQGGLGNAGYQDCTNAMTVTMNIYGTSGLKSSGRVVLGGGPDYLPGPSGGVYYSNPQDALDIATFIRRLFDALPGTGLTPLNLDPASTVSQIVSYITIWTPYTRG
ncbi:MAG: hypothetical protein Q9204_007794 [Flavoplaca sp. TL-2023a]